MPTFCPPVTGRLPNDYIGGNDLFYPVAEPLRRLLRHFQSPEQSANVFLLFSGEVTTVQPYDTDGTIIRRVFYGGHCHPVSGDEIDLLEQAGYLITGIGYGQGAYGFDPYGGPPS